MKKGLGETKKPDLSWLSRRPEPETPVKPAHHASHETVSSPKIHVKPAFPVPTETDTTSERLTIDVPPDLTARLYAEVYHDPRRRFMKEVLRELLEEALKHRPVKGPAPPEYIAQFKIRGRHKKRQ